MVQEWRKGRVGFWLGFQERESFAEGVFCQFGNAVDVEFFHYLTSVGLYGAYTYVKVRGDLFGTFTLGE